MTPRLVPAVLLVWAGTVATAMATLAAAGFPPEWTSGIVSLSIVSGGIGLVGCFLAARRPDSPIGWLMALGGLATAGETLGLALGSGGSAWGAWLASWVWMGAPASIGAVLVLFPDGRMPSPRWRVAAWTLAGLVAASAVSAWFDPGPVQDFPDVSNPIGAGGIVGRVSDALTNVRGMVPVLAMAAAVPALVVRFRRSRGVERQQMKVLALGGLVMGVGIVTAFAATAAGLLRTAPVPELVLAIPISIAVAVLRYRLYDIDRVMSRTASYAIVTALLALTYSVIALTLGRVLGSSDVRVAASTLAVAALFRPVRSRVQSAVDQRFNRARFDAAQAAQSFADRLRQEIDLDSLRGDLVSVVGRTLQPANASLWLR